MPTAHWKAVVHGVGNWLVMTTSKELVHICVFDLWIMNNDFLYSKMFPSHQSKYSATPKKV